MMSMGKNQLSSMINRRTHEQNLDARTLRGLLFLETTVECWNQSDNEHCP